MTLPLVTIQGNLIAEPELRYAASGVAFAKFRVVGSKSKKDDSGKWVDDKATFLTVTAFKDLAENCAESLTRGTEVIVTGRLEQREYETNGEKRTVYEIIADSVGVSLARASAKVTKATRPQQQEADPWHSVEPPF